MTLITFEFITFPGSGKGIIAVNPAHVVCISSVLIGNILSPDECFLNTGNAHFRLTCSMEEAAKKLNITLV
jgi:hypothetical protein